MKRAAIQRIEAAYLVKDRPDFHIGDTVDVGVNIVEGEKTRVQVFSGVLIGRRGVGGTETFTVRRIVAGEGVERIFPLHAPSVAFIRVVRSGRVRRAKLFYLRKRVGKATRLTEERREEPAATAPQAPSGAAGAAEPGS
jgi:large subunit ribosomal protein L19